MCKKSRALLTKEPLQALAKATHIQPASHSFPISASCEASKSGYLDIESWQKGPSSMGMTIQAVLGKALCKTDLSV